LGSIFFCFGSLGLLFYGLAGFDRGITVESLKFPPGMATIGTVLGLIYGAKWPYGSKGATAMKILWVIIGLILLLVGIHIFNDLKIGAH
jgi:hypothetical protein